MQFADCHLHLPLDGAPSWRHAGLTAAVLAAAVPEEWEAVLAASASPDSFFARIPALGVHPWHVRAGGRQEALSRLEELLRQNPRCAVGEVGLDGAPGRPPMALQMQWFSAQLFLAQRLCRPVVVHLVHSWEEGWSLLRQFPSLSVIVHGFHGSSQEARRLLSLPKLFLSLGFDALTPGRRLAGAVREIPPSRLLVDSDAPFRHHSPSELPVLLQALSRQKGLSAEELSSCILQNFQTIFQNPYPTSN